MRSPAGTATGVADHASDSLIARARKANPKATSTALTAYTPGSNQLVCMMPRAT